LPVISVGAAALADWKRVDLERPLAGHRALVSQ
jgi:hypothetical protein